MGQLSQFNREATYRDDKVTVSGSIQPLVDDHGQPLRREHPIHFHFLLVRDGVMITGHTTGIGIGWRGESRAGQGPQSGAGARDRARDPALPGPQPAFETFSWCDADRAPGGLTLPAMAGFRR